MRPKFCSVREREACAIREIGVEGVIVSENGAEEGKPTYHSATGSYNASLLGIWSCSQLRISNIFALIVGSSSFVVYW